MAENLSAKAKVFSALGLSMIWFGIIAGVLVLLTLAAGVVLYLPYRRSAEKRWRDRVLHAQAAARRCLLAERLELQSPGVRRQAEERTLRERAFVSFLHGISVDELQEYPNIGPATIAKLRGAGYTSLAELQQMRFQIPGLGEKRLSAVRTAIRELTRQCRGRFDAGGCREARELASQLQALALQGEDRQRRAALRIRATETFLKALEDRVPIAQGVTVLTYWRTGATPLVAAKILNADLPNLDAVLNAADRQADAAHAGRQKSPVDGVGSSPLPVATPVGGPVAVPVPPAQRRPEEVAVLVQAPVAVPARPAVGQDSNPVEETSAFSREERLAALELDAAIPLSADLVRRQYNLLSERYVPEKVAAMGPEFIEMAATKRAAVLSAATALLEELGEKLEAAAPETGPRSLRENPDLDAMFGA